MIRWWVNHPFNTDNYEVFIVREGLDQYKGYYWHEEEWHLYHYEEMIRPALVLPGILAAQMEASGREDLNEICNKLQHLADEVWEETQRKEPANGSNVSGPYRRLDGGSMRINIYEEEMTNEVRMVEKTVSDTGIKYYGARIYLKSPPELHHSNDDDDRSAVTIWFGDYALCKAFRDRVARLLSNPLEDLGVMEPGTSQPPDEEKETDE